MRRREAIQAMAGLMASSALVNPARAFFRDDDDGNLPELFRKVGPTMGTAPIQVVPLGPGLALITGPGGNVAALTGPDGVVVVDCFVPGKGAGLVSAVRKIDAGPITLFNTHWHFDHAGGNAELTAAGARIIAHENTRKRLESEQYMADFQMKVPPSPKAALPTVCVGETASLHYNGEDVELTHQPEAHTDGDICLFFRKANVLHTGDLFSNGFYPNIDSSSGGWVGGMVAAADRMLGLVNASTRIIPGHGPLGTPADLKAARDMLAAAQAAIEPLVAAGKTVDEAVAARPLASLDARWAHGLFKGSHFTRVVYSGLVKHAGAKAARS